MNIRTRWLDDQVKSSIRDGVKQVVLVAAGYNTIAHRLAAPDVVFFELDRPEVIASKKRLMAQALPIWRTKKEAEGHAEEEGSTVRSPVYVAADLAKTRLGMMTMTPLSSPSVPDTIPLEPTLRRPSPIAAADALAASEGYIPSAPTLFIFEGLLYYLKPDDVQAALQSTYR